MIGRGEMRRWEEEKRTEEMRIGNDCLGREEKEEEDWEGQE